MNITLMLYFLYAKYGVSRMFIANPLMVFCGTICEHGNFQIRSRFFCVFNQPYLLTTNKKSYGQKITRPCFVPDDL